MELHAPTSKKFNPSLKMASFLFDPPFHDSKKKKQAKKNKKETKQKNQKKKKITTLHTRIENRKLYIRKVQMP